MEAVRNVGTNLVFWVILDHSYKLQNTNTLLFDLRQAQSQTRILDGTTSHDSRHVIVTVLRRKLSLVLLPPKRRETLSSKFAFTTTTLISYISKINLNMVLLSTLDPGSRHHPGLEPQHRRCGQPEKKGVWNIQPQEEDCSPAPGHLPSHCRCVLDN